MVIGVDPAKRSHTIEVLDASQTTLATAMPARSTGARFWKVMVPASTVTVPLPGVVPLGV